MERLRDLASLDWLQCQQTGDNLFVFYKDGVLASSVNLAQAGFDLPDLLGFILVGSADRLETIKTRWCSMLPEMGLAFRCIPEYNREAVWGAAIECMAENLALQRVHSGRTALQLVSYRREFERLQQNFMRLEEYVGWQAPQPALELLDYPADLVGDGERSEVTLGDVSGPAGCALIQYLPVDSCGVASFSICISAKPGAEAKPLRVTLRAIETGQVFGVWSIEAAETKAGWIELALASAIDEPAMSLELMVSWPAEKSGWTLALGPPHPYKEFCARTGEGAYLSRPLAMRVLGRVPGVRVPTVTNALRPIERPHALLEFIPQEVYATVAQTLPPPEEKGLQWVSYDPSLRCITVHPRQGGLMTVARMDAAVPRHAWRVSAQIELAHEKASPTYFGLLVAAEVPGFPELAQLDPVDARSRGFSGWKRLSPLETGSISALVAPSREKRLSIFLMTRQATGAVADFAWARFSNFEFNMLPKSLIPQLEMPATGQAAPEIAAGQVSDGRGAGRSGD